MFESFTSAGVFIGTVLSVSLILAAAHWLLIKREPGIGNERLFSRQLIMLGLTIVGVLVCVFVLPISESSRNQLIALIGLLISGILAFSSTTIISNLMAGVLLRITKPFRVGDFIRIGEHFGRISERGLFDTEIQTEARELIALPNTYCISNPVTTIRSSGTIISASLSLGYDVEHRRVEQLLIEAAETCGLTEPFVHITELGNFAVTYRVSGLLEESKRLISMRSKLYGAVLDTLHQHGVEIMSPSFMNQRKISDETKVMPSTSPPTAVDAHGSSAEDIAFDKAELAERTELEKLKLKQEIEALKQTLDQPSDDEHKAVSLSIEQKLQQLKLIETKSTPADLKNAAAG